MYTLKSLGSQYLQGFAPSGVGVYSFCRFVLYTYIHIHIHIIYIIYKKYIHPYTKHPGALVFTGFKAGVGFGKWPTPALHPYTLFLLHANQRRRCSLLANRRESSRGHWFNPAPEIAPLASHFFKSSVNHHIIKVLLV